MGLKLEVGKTYVSNCGSKVRIVCTDRKNSTVPCIGLGDCGDFEVAVHLTASGYATPSFYLVREHDPLEDLPVDTPVWVRDDPVEKWKARHYAGRKSKDGKYLVYLCGKTSHTARVPVDRLEDFGWTYMTNVNPYNEEN